MNQLKVIKQYFFLADTVEFLKSSALAEAQGTYGYSRDWFRTVPYVPRFGSKLQFQYR